MLNLNYQYDQYYRLQADEKFGKNIINWIDDLAFIETNRADFEKVRRDQWQNISGIKATQLSANYLKVEYKAKDFESAVLFSRILKNNLKKKNQALNVGQEKNWFELVTDDAYVTKNNPNKFISIFVLLVFGSLLGILGVLLRHYFE